VVLSCDRASTDRERFESMVVALIDVLPLAERVEALGIPVRAMGMRPGVPDPRGVVRLARLLHRERPQVVQTWMDHSNLIGGVAARLAARAPVIWGVHHANHIPRLTKGTTLMTVSACARLSRWLPTRIVCCSESVREAYARRGFAAERLTVIPNGLDTDVFRPDPAARRDVRQDLGLAPDATLIGLVARYNPFKDHANFLRAAAALKGRLPDVHFLLCGNRVDPGNETLASMVAALGLQGHCHLLGLRRDMPRLQARPGPGHVVIHERGFPPGRWRGHGLWRPMRGDGRGCLGLDHRGDGPGGPAARPPGPGRGLGGVARPGPGRPEAIGPGRTPPHPGALRPGEHRPALRGPLRDPACGVPYLRRALLGWLRPRVGGAR